ncbi:MAG: ATP-dependent helicase [Eubacteriales bacterium]|nr:ATP-dependent helicase [Eubacteriales bacterium]
MADILDSLNAAQRDAVTTTEGFVRVIAGAGTGKTRALSHRFAWLVNEAGILPGHILCVTFTNKSANEMRERIRRLTGDNDAGYVCTFHSFCVSVLQEDSHAVQYPKSFLVLDNSDIDAMLGIIYEERGLTLRHMSFRDARDMIEIRKTFKDPEYYEDMIAMPLEDLHRKYMQAEKAEDIIFYGYLYQEKKCFGLDYNDLIKFTLFIFAENEAIRLKWQKRLEYVMIDEFQDIDGLQHRLMEVLCAYHGNLFVVGDPDQTIYSFRGANVRYLLEFDRTFPGTKTIMMTENYRSAPQILAVANALIRNNKNRIDKELTAARPEGAPVICHHAKSSEKEADWIAEKIRQLTGFVPEHERETGHDGERCAAGKAETANEEGKTRPRLSDIAILYRAHYITRNLEEGLRRAGIPYTLYSGVQFFDRMEIKDALSYLRMAVYQDDLSFLRIANVPKRNLGERRIAFLKEYAAEHDCSLYEALCRNLEDGIFRNTKAAAFAGLIDRYAALTQTAGLKASELLAKLLDESGYERMLRTEGSQERLDNLAELKQSVHQYEISCGEECGPEDYLRHAALFSNRDLESRGDAVRLMTVHTAKGLEFPHVFFCALSEGIFPSRRTKTREAMEEERRLAFVAMTRAEDGLYLSEAEGCGMDGAPRYPSRFLLDIGTERLMFDPEMPKQLYTAAKSCIEASDRRLEAEMASKDALFHAGDRVRHAIFGKGTVLETDETERTYLIRFDELDTERRLTFRVKLEALRDA